MIKCNDFSCGYNDQKKKQGCSRESDPHVCKGCLTTIICIQQRTIEEMEKKIKADVIPCVQEVFDCISTKLGDTDPHMDEDMSEEEMQHEYPLVWSCQRLIGVVSMLNDINDI